MIDTYAARGRITPACAGKTGDILKSKLDKRDHPRVCGKNFKYIIGIRNYLGSPPRVREKLFLFTCEFFGVGITPACAGKTSSHKVSKTFARDHPRVCGKNDPLDGDLNIREGSPPRVREKQYTL